MDRRSKINLFSRQIIKRILLKYKNHHLSLKKITKLYYAEDSDFNFSLETLLKFLKNQFRKRYKKIKLIYYRRNTNRVYLIKSIFLKYISNLVLKENTIIYLQESSFSNANSRIKTWIGYGEIQNLFYPGRLQSQKLILAAVSKEKIIHYSVTSKITNANDIIIFLKEIY